MRLFRDYIAERHSEGGMADMSVFDYSMMVEDSAVETFVTEYRRVPGSRLLSSAVTGDLPLIGAALCDRLSDGLSLVYSFYDPDATTTGAWAATSFWTISNMPAAWTCLMSISAIGSKDPARWPTSPASRRRSG